MTEGVRQEDLARFALFEGLSGDELAPLIAVAVRRRFVDGEAIFEQGLPATSLFAILGGRIALRSTIDGRSVIVQTIDAGHVVGWSALPAGATWLTTARAVGDADLVAIPAAAMLDVLASGAPHARILIERLFAIAAAHLDATRAQLLRAGEEGVITAG